MSLQTLQVAQALSLAPTEVASTVTITEATPAVVTVTGLVSGQHYPVNNDVGFFAGAGTVGTGLAKNTLYFVVDADPAAHTFEVSATYGGSPIATSGASSGTLTWSKVGSTSPSNETAISVAGPYDLQNKPSNGALNTYTDTDVSATDASPAVFSPGVSGYVPFNGQPVLITTNAPAGFINGQSYFAVNVVAATSFELSETVNGTPVTSTGTTSTASVLYGPYQPILPVTSAGQGTPDGAGETPFLPDYSTVLYYHLASFATATSVDIQGSNGNSTDGSLDGTETWYSYLPAAIAASGSAMVEVHSLYRWFRVIVNGQAYNQAGTLTIDLLGDA